LDGRLTRSKKESRWITSAAARRHAHTLRAQIDAILIGAATLRIDNPQLTARGHGKVRQPKRVVLTRSGKLPRHAYFFRDPKNSFVYRDLPLAAVLAELGEKAVTSVLLAGGGKMRGHALGERLIGKVQSYIARTLTGRPVVA